jgi:tetratricopeptide (TPR) repeat protein
MAAAIVVATISLAVATGLLTRANSNERAAKQEALNQQERAEQSYQLARKGLENALAIRDDERLQSGKFEDIRKTLAKTAASFYEQFVELHGEEESFRFERAMAYGKLGGETAFLGNHEEAADHFEKAVTLLEKLRADFPENIMYLDYLQRYGNEWGLACVYLKRFPRAEKILHTNQLLQAELVGLKPDNLYFLFCRAQTTLSLGTIYQETHRLDEAGNAFKRGLSWMTEVTAKSPKTGKEAVGYWSSLASFHTHLVLQRPFA